MDRPEMCIRDRHISANSAMRLDDDIVEAMRKMEQMEDIVRRPVSYTHLDVYKRQASARGGGGVHHKAVIF